MQNFSRHQVFYWKLIKIKIIIILSILAVVSIRIATVAADLRLKSISNFAARNTEQSPEVLLAASDLELNPPLSPTERGKPQKTYL